MRKINYIDLFCGIGGFRIAMEQAAEELLLDANCVFSCDIDKEAQRAYYYNFKEIPLGDIKNHDENKIPEHDILFAGFPCQPFSIIGKRNGFEDTRGTLFFDIARILEAKQPNAFILENVKLLVGHNKGRTFKRILETLDDLGYYISYKVLNALNFGLPQKRERVIIIGSKRKIDYVWPNRKYTMAPLDEILEKNIPPEYYVSDYIKNKRMAIGIKTEHKYTIWHENKQGHISAYPYSCALRAGASYNYLLVNGERRLTPREMLRLQGFPDTFKIVCNYSQTRKQAGNAVPVPMVKAALKQLLFALDEEIQIDNKYELRHYYESSQIKNRSESKATFQAK